MTESEEALQQKTRKLYRPSPDEPETLRRQKRSRSRIAAGEGAEAGC